MQQAQRESRFTLNRQGANSSDGEQGEYEPDAGWALLNRQGLPPEGVSKQTASSVAKDAGI